jgi:chitodextrinase
MRRLRSTIVAALLTATAVPTTVAVTTVTTAAPAQAAPVICEQFGGTYIQNNTRRVQNNVWGASTAQCIDVNQNGGFTVTQAAHNNATNGAPAAYPSIYAGCHYAQCTTGSGLPMQASASNFGSVQTSVSMTYPASGTWNAAYDLWFDPTPRTDGQNTGAEIMVWLNYQGSIQPVGSQVATVNMLGATWQVWFGDIGWNVISYRRTSPTTSLSFAVDTFLNDAISRGYAQRSWYLTSVQAGFEPWVGGTGLAVSSFSYTTSGTPGDTTSPSTPQNLTVTGTTSNSASLSWSASTDNVGVTGYDILRAPGVSGGSFTQVGTSTTTSFTDTGLTASTTYRYQVRARDVANNVSGVSGTATATTQPGGGTTSCTVHFDQWGTGYVAYVTVTGPRSGWSFAFALPGGHVFQGGWNAGFTLSGPNVTAVNMSYNGNLGSGQSTQWGFQTSRPNGNTQLPTLPGCTVV